MRVLVAVLLLTGAVLASMVIASNRFPEKADEVVDFACGQSNASWFCEATRPRIEVEDDAGNRYSCKLNGCCSQNKGIKYLDLETEQVVCRNGNPSPSCRCKRNTE